MHASPRPPLPIRPRFRLRPAEPLLGQYKSLLKKSLAHRDDDDASRNEADVRVVLRDIERWLAEARVAADTQPTTTTNEFMRLDFDDDDFDDPTEAWALDRLCEALLARGALVPLSRKCVAEGGFLRAFADHDATRKRTAAPKGSHFPPPSLLAIWTPLLESLVASPRHAYLRAALSSHILVRLLADRHQQLACSDEAAVEGTSYELCLAAWGAWLVEWRLAHETDADVSARREDVFFQLIHALCASCPCPQRCDEETAPLACQPGFVSCVRSFKEPD